MDEIITQEDLRKKIGLSYSALHCHLSRFDKYVTNRLSRKKTYIYNLEFLQELRTFYQGKVNGFKNYNKDIYEIVVMRIDRLIKEWKLKEKEI